MRAQGRSSDEAKNLADIRSLAVHSVAGRSRSFLPCLNEKTAAARADYLAPCRRRQRDVADARGTASQSPSGSGGFPGSARGGLKGGGRREVSRRLRLGAGRYLGAACPATIGRYRVIRLLGSRGLGRPTSPRTTRLRRPVAVKAPNPERVAGPKDVAVYLAEAQFLAQLDHSNIVPVYYVGQTDDGLCYVVSKYIEGTSLAERMGRGRMPFGEATCGA